MKFTTSPLSLGRTLEQIIVLKRVSFLFRFFLILTHLYPPLTGKKYGTFTQNLIKICFDTFVSFVRTLTPLFQCDFRNRYIIYVAVGMNTNRKYLHPSVPTASTLSNFIDHDTQQRVLSNLVPMAATFYATDGSQLCRLIYTQPLEFSIKVNRY